MDIVAANQAYEDWLRHALQGAVVEDDLRAKHTKMSDGAFPFLRATYWRWAETILDVCPDLSDAPAVLAVGDTHLENFGTWRDDDGRLIWGVNDFDECAEMPYALDLVRLATSAALAGAPTHLSVKSICAHLLDGYKRGIDVPAPFVLDRDHLWLRNRFVVKEKERAAFWRKIDKQAKTSVKKRKRPPPRWLSLFAAALPEPVDLLYWQRAAGTGSLGRPRWLGYGPWRGGPLLREGKALVASGWTRAHRGDAVPRLNDIARGRFRAPDPWYAEHDNVLLRRLSANNRKLEVKKPRDIPRLLHPTMLQCMGQDLAAVHLGVGNHRDAIRKNLGRRKKGWFKANVDAALAFVSRDYADWAKAHK